RTVLDAGEGPLVDLATEETGAASWKGRVVRLAPEIDERTRTGRAFVVVENSRQSQPLVPGTFVHARITGLQHGRAVVIPRDAISVDNRGREFVWVARAEPAMVDPSVSGGPTADARTIERRLLVDQHGTRPRMLQTLALVEPGILQEG
ncbi:MAG: hypothetical protein VYA62_01555, partial [Planctomycetota bacterium]|nr:hypothetical protein [Planctomycetota bacterium]